MCLSKPPHRRGALAVRRRNLCCQRQATHASCGCRAQAVVARILVNWNLDITKRVSVTSHYINSRPSVQAWMAFCCKFPAFLLPMAQKLSCKGRICSKGSPWSAGDPSYPVRLRVALWGSCYAVAVCRHRYPGLHLFFCF